MQANDASKNKTLTWNAKMMTVTIKADDENNAEAFWAAFDEAFPEIASEVRSGAATVDAATWEAIQKLEGFADGPKYASQALLAVSTTAFVGKNYSIEINCCNQFVLVHPVSENETFDTFDEMIEAHPICEEAREAIEA